MKKKNSSKLKRAIKRTISAVIALSILSGSLPLDVIPRNLKLPELKMTVKAADVQDFSNNPTIRYYSQLVDYAEAYRQYPDSHHENDIIEIAIINGQTTDLMSDFIGIGTSDRPFAGKIVVNSNSFSNFNIDTAFFNYIYDYVEIDVQDASKTFTINTAGDNSGAVFAEHVMHDTSENLTYDAEEAQSDTSKTLVTPAEWTVKIEDYEGNPHSHSSIIGEMDVNAEATVSIINNATSSFSSASGNVGTICGTMKAGSKLTVESISGSNTGTVSADSGNAGGLVGEMEAGSALTIESIPSSATITASGYAGGLVGKNDSATVTISSTPVIRNMITGTLGAGGAFGYYKPIMTDNAYSLDLKTYTIGAANGRCRVSSSGGAGGFAGVLDNPGGTISLYESESKTIYAQGNGDGTVFGGVIGSYQANSIEDTLALYGSAANKMLTVNTNKSGNLAYYGGLIGKIDGAFFAKIDYADVTAYDESAKDEYFGGAVACADTGYVYVNNLTLSATSYRGGAIVGHTSNGVVHIAGATNLTNATSDVGSNYGQIVGYRDSALVFADSTWNLTRNSTTVATDDIGSWGEVVRFKSSDFAITDVLDSYYDPSAASPAHYATIKSAVFNDNASTKIQFKDKAEFARAALNMQLNAGTSDSNDSSNTAVLRFADVTNSKYATLSTKDVVMTASVDLSHTGMTGLTRDNKNDNWTIEPVYAGSEFNGTSVDNVLTLAIGEGYDGTDSTSIQDASGKGMIYHHRYNGLFGETSSDFTVKNITISGVVNTNDSIENSAYYVGTVAGNAAAAFNADTVTIDSSTKVTYASSSDKHELYVGGLVGKMATPGTSTIGATTHTANSTNSTFSAKVSGSASNGSVYIGGVCGYVGAGGSVSVTDVKITNEVSNSSSLKEQKLGGLFAVIADGTNTLTLNGVNLNGLTVKGDISDSGSMGGLFGYSWDGVTATFDNITVTTCVLDNDTTTGNQAALVYTGSGYWKFKGVAINGLTLSGSAASSLGMLVNKAYSSSKAMYLELPKDFTYTIANVSTSVSGATPTLYDELAVYTVMPNNSIEANGNSVISINTKGTTRYSTQSDGAVNMTSGSCNTYQNQVTDFIKTNPNSRYYYNVDNYIGESNTGAAALYLWSVYQYAHSTIQSNIASTAPSSTFSGDLDLDGYSYYPVDVKTGTVNISGTVGLYNKDIEDKEGASNGGSDGYARTTLNTTKTQHYLMHAGLFRNVNGTININGTLSISGTIPDVNTYCGALICGTINGDSETNASVNSKTGSIVLAGISVHNKDDDYSPLLINKASTYVTLDIYNVSATASEYAGTETVPPAEEGGTPTIKNVTKTAATSLIGIVGSDTAEKVEVTFDNIKLDARTAESTLNSLTDVYGTKQSIFTKATLLHSLSYKAGSGSSGVYNYEHDEDWTTRHVGNVTYGIEISSDDSVNKGKEYYYYKKYGQSSYYTNPSLDSISAGRSTFYDFTGFKPYVAVWGTQIGTSATKHQLDVNHSAATFGGCGTYDDPFVIVYNPEDTTNTDKSGGLVTISKIIARNVSSLGSSYTISLPDDLSETWCDNKSECHVYTFNGTDKFIYTYTEEGETKTKEHSLDAVRGYLAGAYYYLSSNIEIEASSGFEGLGFKRSNDTSDYAVFHGIIIGDGRTITNKTTNPLIRVSNGCVVKNVTIKPSFTSKSISTSNSFAANGGAETYGAVIGRVMGGDNIIDQVTVDLSSATVTAGNYRATVGSYVGVVVEGGLFFRNMDKVTKNVLFSGGVYAEADKDHLYCNPYIGRVINGFAVNETASNTSKDTYAPYENGKRKFGDGTEISGNKVSLLNGNKNYSITDLDPDLDKLSVSGTTINVPNSQAFFIMSLVVNSGMGSSSSPVIGYYGTNQISRHSNYAYVGTNIKVSDYKTDSNTDEEALALFKATDEYKDYKITENDTNTNAHLISNYTTGDDAKSLGSGSGFTLNVNADLILPDGYKGIGNVFNNSANLSLALTTFDGNNHTISQNTTFDSYTKDNSKNQDNYLPYQAFTVHGLGLFNYVNNATFQDCILSGNVVTRQYDAGTALNYVNEQDYTGLAAAMLVGALNMNGSATISDVYLQNVKVESARDAAGMVGYLISDSKSNSINITNSTTNTNQSNKIWISGGTCAAGLISRQGKANAQGNGGVGDISVAYNNHHFDFNSIVSRFDGDNTTSDNKWNSEWALGVGGIIGPARCNDSGSNANTISIDKVIIGSDTSDTSTRTVACQYGEEGSETEGQLYVGGLVGIANRAPVTVTNCKVYNVTVSSQKYSGGVLGWGGTASNVTFTNCIIKSTMNARVYTSGNEGKAGCVVGFCKSDMGSITLKNSTIDGYAIEANDAGGVLGDWQANGAFSIVDSEIMNCTVTYLNAGGGIAGKLQKNLAGYNFRISGITLAKKGNAGTTYEGYLIGNRSGGTVKIVGLHRTGTVSPPNLVGSATADTTTGLYSSSDLYGTGGYVIFADFDGTSLTPSNQAVSSINLKGDTAVTGYGAKPYITINPANALGSNIGLLTGDGVSSDAVNHILTDESNRKYTVADMSRFLNASDTTVNTTLISSFKKELGSTVANEDYDFPLLVINSNDTAEDVVNDYLRVLTNTDSVIDFTQRYSNNQDSKIGINGTYNANYGTLTIRKCNYNNGVITVSSNNNDASLYLDNSNSAKLQIRSNNGKYQYDTATEGQFTLIDIAFKDPTTSSNPKVVYHLYVPVIVKKLVEYNFDISVLSGTQYDRSLYGTESNGVRGRALLENLGAPVTFEFEYNYHRTVKEWNQEGAGYYYDKYLSFTNTGNYDFGSDVKALLIDITSGESYYLDNWANAFTWNNANDHTKGGKLNLQVFRKSDGSGTFTPMTFTEMISAQGLSESDTITERYYLTLYTPKYTRAENDNSTQVAHYTVASVAFNDSDHPSRRIDCEAQTTRQPHNSVHLLVGDFYTNTLTVTATNPDRKMSSSNKQVTVTLNTTLQIVNAETSTAIGTYLGYKDVTLYQSFLLAFEKYLTAGTISETGISAIDECSVEFTITQTNNQTHLTSTIPVSRREIVMARNFIELQNNTDFSEDLPDGPIEITATAVMSFNDDETRNAQFPKASDSDVGIGALVVGSSNISSLKENTAYSSVSSTKLDSNGRYYYRTSEQAAYLKYYADYSGANKTNQRDTQLGINARELEEDNKSSSKIYTEVQYDASELLNVNKLQYIKCTVKLYRKNTSGSYDIVPLNKYINGLTVNSSRVTVYANYNANDTAATEFTYVYAKANVDQFQNEENVFKIPIEFNVITGKTTGFKDDEHYIYANYKVEVTVSAFDKDHSTDTTTINEVVTLTPWVDYMIYSCPTADYVIYTNARIYTDQIKAS